MPYAQPSVLKLLAVLALVSGVGGCALDKETEVRDLVSDWVQLGDTLYFKSKMNCTAGVFKVDGNRITSFIDKARSVHTGMELLDEGKPVAFDVKGVSPNAVSEAVMSKSLPRGIGVLSSGVAGKDCMDPETKNAYLRSLLDPNAVLMFEPNEKFMAVLDRSNKRLYFSRGNV